MLAIRSRVGLVLLGIVATVSMAGAWGLAVQTVLMRAVNLTGGTAYVGWVTPSAIDPSTRFWGETCNGQGFAVTGLDFKLKNTTSSGAAAVAVGKDPAPVKFDEAGFAHYEYPDGQSLEADGCTDYRISAVTPDSSGAPVEFNVAPTVNQTIKGVNTPCNILRKFEFDHMADLKRDGIAQMFRSSAVTLITNRDDRWPLTDLSGEAAAFGGAGNLVAIHVKNDEGRDIADARVEIHGSRFSIGAFHPLEEDQSMILVFEFSSALEGAPMRAQIQAQYAR